MTPIARFLTVFVLLVSFAVPLSVSSATAQEWDDTRVTITSGGKVHSFLVELATTSAQHSKGLMYRKYLGPEQGMLFIYRKPQRVSMWMKNTFIPLDMIFINSDGSIARIAERAVPHSETVIPSGGRVRAVLEVRAGTADRLGLKPGDLVEHPAL